jgi:Protein of unknown function (DUF3667)
MSQICRNCGAELTGPFCSHCGQAAHHSARSMGTLMHDSWHDLTHLDGRLWRTLVALVLRPGLLTTEYFRDRRTRYLPPFRTYFVLALVYFALLGLGPDHPARVTVTPIATAARSSNCTSNLLEGDSTFTRLMHDACLRVAAAPNGALGHSFLAALPRALFLFLPLVAAVMLLLYWHPRRLFVEHLVFLLHNHAAAFLAFSIASLVQIASRSAPALQVVAGFFDTAVGIYLAIYLFIALKRYYAQGFGRTALKYVTLALIYGVGFVVLLAATGLYSFLTL